MQASVANLPLYLQPWWWDAATGDPSAWQAAQLRDQDDTLLAYWPYLIKKRFGLVRYGSLPPFCPRSGPWLAPAPPGTGPSRVLKRQWDLLNRLEEQLPRLTHFRAKTPYSTENLMPLQRRGWRAELRYSYQLPTNTESADQIRQRFSGTTRNQLRQAKRSVKVRQGAALGDLLELMAKVYRHRGLREQDFPRQSFGRIFHACQDRKQSVCWSAVDSEGRTSAGGWFAHDHERLYAFLPASDPGNRQNGAMSLLMATAIDWAVLQGLTFDFEGSALPGVEEFYRGFGPELKPYALLTRSILSQTKSTKSRAGF